MTPKSIAVINFKGGVGKTTVTWSLGNIISQNTDLDVLMLDLDPQMSLTEAIGLNESTGHLDDKFGKWYEKSIRHRLTIYDALEVFKRAGQNFKFPVGFETIYQVDEQLHFIPSVEELYWLDLDGFEGKSVKDFIRRLIGKVANSPNLPKYELFLFDCPELHRRRDGQRPFGTVLLAFGQRLGRCLRTLLLLLLCLLHSLLRRFCA